MVKMSDYDLPVTDAADHPDRNFGHVSAETIPTPRPRPVEAPQSEGPGKYTNEPYKRGLYFINPFRNDQY